jgi:hypothetical protein
MFDAKTAQLMTLEAEKRKTALIAEECSVALKKIEQGVQQAIAQCATRCSFNYCGFSPEVLTALRFKLRDLGYKVDDGRDVIWIDWKIESRSTKEIRTFGR